MPSNKHSEIIKKLYDEVYSNGHLLALDQFFETDVKVNFPANSKKGLAGLKEQESKYKMAFPTRNVKIEHLWNTTDDSIVVHWSFQATHKGLYEDIPPTGKNIKMTGITIYQFSGNKISEITQQWDQLGLLEQLGLSELAARS